VRFSGIRLYPIPIAPPIFVVLNVIVKDEAIRSLNLIEEAEPGEITGLKHRQRPQAATSPLPKKSIEVPELLLRIIFSQLPFCGYMYRSYHS
jgi:hypothetical protein